MTTKEKLELLWKYLLLIVIVFGIFAMSNTHEKRIIKMIGSPDHEMMFFHDMDEDMEFDGDSTMIININGKVLTGEDALKWHAEHKKDFEGMEPMMKKHHDGKVRKEVRIKKMKKDDD